MSVAGTRRSKALLTTLVVALISCGPTGVTRFGEDNETSLPDGLLLVGIDGTVWARSPEGEERSLGEGWPLDITRDGSKAVAALSEREPTGITRNTELVSIDLASGDREVIARAADSETFLQTRWSPDGSAVAYRLATWEVDPSKTHPGEGREALTLCVLEVARSSVSCLEDLGPVHDFDWSPDGASLLVTGPGGDPVVSVDALTGRVSEVIPAEGGKRLQEELERRRYGRAVQFLAPRWSPSGGYIAVLASLIGGSGMRVPVVFTADGEFVSLGAVSTEAPAPEAFEWSPFEDVLAYTRGEPPYTVTELHLHDPAAGESRLLTTTGDRPRDAILSFAWDPDGGWIAVCYNRQIGFVDEKGDQTRRGFDVIGDASGVFGWSPLRS